VKPFVFQHTDRPWDPAASLFHVYATIDPDRDHELAALVTGAHRALADFPLTPVELPWIHVTLDQVTDWQAARIPHSERDGLVTALTERLADFPPFEVMVGSLLSYASGVIADLHPDDRLTALHHVVRDAIRDTRGEQAVRYPWGVQHLTIGYARQEASCDDAQRILRRIRPGHTRLHIDAVHLVDVTADGEAKTITWKDLAAIPLAGSR
jgi:hypothetical protein